MTHRDLEFVISKGRHFHVCLLACLFVCLSVPQIVVQSTLCISPLPNACWAARQSAHHLISSHLICPCSPPSETRLPLCCWTLWTSRLFAFLKWCTATLPQRTRRSRSVQNLLAIRFQAALRSVSLTSTTAAQKRIALCGAGIISRQGIWASRSARV